MTSLTLRDLRNKALSFLSIREYSYKEMLTKLKKYTDDETEIIKLLTWLKEKNWLSDERYINSFATSKSKKYGLIKIRYDLKKRVDDPELVDKILAKIDLDQYELALNLWQKKFGQTSKDPKEYARQFRFLQNKGFSFDIIKKILS